MVLLNILLFLYSLFDFFHRHDFFPSKKLNYLVIFYKINKYAILAEIYNFRKFESSDSGLFNSLSS